MDPLTFTAVLATALGIFILGFLCGKMLAEEALPPAKRRTTEDVPPNAEWIKRHAHLFIRAWYDTGLQIRTKVRHIDWTRVTKWQLD